MSDDRTIHLSAEVTIERPAADVWAIVADYDRDPDWRAGVRTMAPSPRGLARVGTTTAEELRFAGRTWHNDGEVVAVDPGRSFAWRTVRGADAWGSRTVQAVGQDRCAVRLELHVRPQGSERLLRPLLARMLRRGLQGDATRLGRLLGSAPGVEGRQAQHAA